MSAQITTDNEWHDKVEALFRGKEVVHVTQINVFSFEEHLELRVYRLDGRTIFNKFVFADVLDSELLAWVVFEMSEENSAETALTELLQDFEITKLDIWQSLRFPL